MNETPNTPARTWTSWHLHLAASDRSLSDRVVTDVVGPAMAALPPGSWFFMRYWQGGPHVRLRARDLAAPDAAALGGVLRETLAAANVLLPGETPVDPARFAVQSRQLATAGEGGVPVEERELLAPGVYESPYSPEYGRYGGPALIGVSEDLFGSSSALCLAFLRTRPSDRARTALALRATAVAASVLDAGLFAAFGAGSWSDWALKAGYPQEVLTALEAECVIAADRLTADGHDLVARATSSPGPLASWRTALSEAVDGPLGAAGAYTARIVFSHVHMLHNRLGLGTLDELRSYLLLARQAGVAIPAAPRAQAAPAQAAPAQATPARAT
ncbi:thiopeptide-type bacteriocin biosynthesis protein [Streptomyces katrae]|uniref:thiopeptide-type bacteriocin biosynthesis protein n=1 Tax=Streptomyces katrae TaxID=68223 RepID=UPI0006990613|nr:thiopeptide-type bacteriocin biosynthesis protein [Streptomyces katrae]